MPQIEVIWEWDDPEGNVAHVAEHGVTPQEVEQALQRVHHRGASPSTDRPLWFGWTDAGRYIAVAFEWIDPITVYPVTAFDVEECTMPNVSRSKRKLPPEEVRRLKRVAQEVDADEGDAIRALGRRHKREAERLISVFRQLQAERQRQGLSLADVAERSGMDKGRLSRLENDPHPNVTLETVDRYAAALGKQVVCALADATDD